MKENYSLQLKNIDKIYENGFQAIFNTNINIKKNEFIVLVGPSGCGKTTTLRTIAGLERVSNGSIYIDREDVTEIDAKFRNISMVFQSYALFPHLSVRENIAFTLKVKRYPRDVIEQKVAWAAKELGLEYYLSRKPKALSGGQRQRVALGRAIVADPKLFLLDEPLSNLDAKLRATMRSSIRALHDRLNVTTVYVTHDQIEAMTMADRIVVMRDGFVQQIDTPAQVFDHPSNIFVAGFIGTPAVNFIEGKVQKGHFVAKGFKVKLIKEKLKNVKDGQSLTLGIRPQHIHFASIVGDAFEKSKISGKIVAKELLGSESIVTLKDDSGRHFRILVDNYFGKKIGDKTSAFISVNRILLFDPETTFSLTSPINDETMAALNSWRNSSEEIKIRKAIMEREKRKGQKLGVIAKTISYTKDTISPVEFSEDDKLSKLKITKGKTKNEIKEAKRLLSRDKYLLNEKIKKLKDKLAITKLKDEFNQKRIIATENLIKKLNQKIKIISAEIVTRKKAIRGEIVTKKAKVKDRNNANKISSSRDLKVQMKKIVKEKNDAQKLPKEKLEAEFTSIRKNILELKNKLLKAKKLREIEEVIDLKREIKLAKAKIIKLKKQNK